MIRIENLRKFYGRHPALAVDDLLLVPGVHWVKGANGSGKTTFFKILAGLLPFEGEVFLDRAALGNGSPAPSGSKFPSAASPGPGLPPAEGIRSHSPLSLRKNPVDWRRMVNYGEAEPLYPAFVTGRELIRLFADGKRAPAGQVDFLLDRLGAGSFVDQTAGTYSSGMRKKLSLVLAFVGQPAVILLDEPLNTLDHAAVDAVYGLVEDCRQRDTTLLVSSHQAFESGKLAFTSVLQVADRTVYKERN